MRFYCILLFPAEFLLILLQSLVPETGQNKPEVQPEDALLSPIDRIYRITTSGELAS